MSFVENIIEKLFPAASSPNEPLLVETLERSKSDQLNYQLWLQVGKFREFGQLFMLAYILKKKQIKCSTNIHLLKSKIAQAFSITYNEEMGAKNFQHYFDYMKNVLVRTGYILQHSDREITDRAHYVETVERYYLKFPELVECDGRYSQWFGNIVIEHVSINDKPSYVKVLTTYQTDSHYSAPVEFDELANKLFIA